MTKLGDRIRSAVSIALDAGWDCVSPRSSSRYLFRRGDREVVLYEGGGKFFLDRKRGAEPIDHGWVDDDDGWELLLGFLLAPDTERARAAIWEAMDALEAIEPDVPAIREAFDDLNAAGVRLARFAGADPNSRPKE